VTSLERRPPIRDQTKTATVSASRQPPCRLNNTSNLSWRRSWATPLQTATWLQCSTAEGMQGVLTGALSTSHPTNSDVYLRNKWRRLQTRTRCTTAHLIFGSYFAASMDNPPIARLHELTFRSYLISVSI